MSDARLVEWFCGGDTGMSSMAIAAVMSGADLGKIQRLSPPSDPADLGRCLRLLEIFPEWKSKIHLMAGVSNHWGNASTHWDELEKTMIDEVGIDWSKGQRAPKTYKVMKQKIFNN